MTMISEDRLREILGALADHGGATSPVHYVNVEDVCDMARELLAICTAAAEPAAFIVERPLASGGTHLYLPFLRAGDEADRWRKANPDEKLVALYISPPPSGEAGEVKVRPLDWRLHNSFGDLRGFGIDTSLYAVSNVDTGAKVKWHLSSFVRELGYFDTVDEAKVAAQSDYETRIRSALLPTIKEPADGA